MLRGILTTKEGQFQFYRAEHNFLLQGVMGDRIAAKNIEKGPCPVGVDLAEEYPNRSVLSEIKRLQKQRNSEIFVCLFCRRCFEHDPNCGCHGPIMTRGDVGWAGGGTGPDFFIVDTDGPVSNSVLHPTNSFKEKHVAHKFCFTI